MLRVTYIVNVKVNCTCDKHTSVITNVFVHQHTVVDADHRGGWKKFSGKASEPETSRPVEKRNFYIFHLHLAPQLGVIPAEFRRDLLHQKLVPELSCGVVCVILRLDVLIQFRLVSDEQTHDDSKYHDGIASRG